MEEPCIQIVRQKIRYATEPDNPALFNIWLKHDNPNISDSIPRRRRHYECQFQLLLETIVDDLIPTHWRRICLDYIYQPIGSLKRLSDGEKSDKRIRLLIKELNISCSYSEQSLYL